ncbi:MAG: cation transporter [Bacteroidales bacterium]|nr:cation transporter [Bacteroidales bacterium]
MKPIRQDTRKRKQKLAVAIVLNLFITAAQAIGGFFSGSLSLLSDALHNLGDVTSLIISYLAVHLTAKKHTVKRTFGYKRAETMAAFINAGILLVIAVFLALEALKRFSNPSIIRTEWVMILAGAGIAVNGISAGILHRDARHNLNVRSSYLHLLTDVLSSVAVLAGGFIMHMTGYYPIDSILTLILAVFLFYSAWSLLKKTSRVLMLFTPEQITVGDICEKILEIPHVKNVHHVHVWQLDDYQVHFEAHIGLNENLKLDRTNGIMKQVRTMLKERFGIRHTTLQPEYGVCDHPEMISQEGTP